MGNLHDFTVKHNRFVMDLENVIKTIITDNDDLLNLNREQLKEEHKTAKDQFISPEYSYFTRQIKGFKIPDLYDTGAMFEAMKLRKSRDGFIITSMVKYTADLTEKYGSDIFGIAPSKQGKAKQITTSELSRQYKKIVYS